MKIGWFIEKNNLVAEVLMQEMEKDEHLINEMGEITIALSIDQFNYPEEKSVQRKRNPRKKIPRIKEKEIEDIPISIAMTNYNHERYIKAAIKSVVKQTHKNWELIIVEDNSTDGSLQVIEECIVKYGIEKKVNVIKHDQNKGYGASLGESIMAATNDLVVILDSDDALYTNTVFQTCINTHQNHPEASMTYSNFIVCHDDLKMKIDKKGKPLQTKSRQIEEGEDWLDRSPKTEEVLRTNLPISHLKVLKRKFYDLTEGINSALKKTVDKDLVLKLEEVGKLIYIDKPLLLYRKHTGSMNAAYHRASKKEKQKIINARHQIFNSTLKRRAKQKETNLCIFIDGSRRNAIRRMFSYWRSQGAVLVAHPTEANVQFSTARKSTKSNLPTLLRLDGIYYDKDLDYRIKNEGISQSHSFVEAIVYQSDCSRSMCERYLLERKTNYHQIIHNGVDKSNWYNPADHEGINVVSCSKWRRIKRLPEMIKIFEAFRRVYPEAKLHIIGEMARGGKKISSENVIYYGSQSLEKIKEIYRTGDIALHLCKKDSCPSNVPESIAAGIPVVTTNLCGGATEMCELVEGCKIVYEGEQDFKPDYIYRDSYNEMSKKTEESFVEAMVSIIQNKIRVELPEQLSIEYVAQKYLTMMENIKYGSL